MHILKKKQQLDLKRFMATENLDPMDKKTENLYKVQNNEQLIYKFINPG